MMSHGNRLPVGVSKRCAPEFNIWGLNFLMINLTIGAAFNTDLGFLKELKGVNVSFFGAPQRFSLDGGRILSDENGRFEKFTKELRLKEIPFNLCCNTVLDETQVRIDKSTLKILEDNYNSENGVIVSRIWLALKLKKLFPDYKLIFSSIGFLVEEWDEHELFELFDIVVCPVSKLNDFFFIQDKSNYLRLEIFLNSECVGFNDDCINHYLHNSFYNMNLKEESFFGCPFIDTSLVPINMDVITYRSLGVTHFKLIDRTSPLENISKYLEILKG